MSKHLWLFALLMAGMMVGNSANGQNIKKFTATPNSTGMKLGFWEVFNEMDTTLKYFGKRPTSRVDFRDWSSIEKTCGQYTWNGVFDNYKLAHEFGETILGAVNISFSDMIGSKRTVPDCYASEKITNPATRLGALKFVDTFVKEAIKEVGNVTITFDYEVVSNWQLYDSGSEARADTWADWYVDAVTQARASAASIGKSSCLKLEPIVNGNPFDPKSPIHYGRLHNNWLVRAVDTSDYLALDTYQSDTAFSNKSASTTFKIIKFWTDSFSGSKPVVVTENGFNSVTSIIDSIGRNDRQFKTTGTEADQDTFYRNIFDSLSIANKPTGYFKGKVRSYNIWAITDNVKKDTTDPDRYFGLIGVRGNNTTYLKQALPTVQAGYATMEADSYDKPYNISTGIDSSAAFLAGRAHDTVHYNHGDDFEYIQYFQSSIASASSYYLHVITGTPCHLIVSIKSGTKMNWVHLAQQDTFSADITQYISPGFNTTIQIYCTNDVYPFVTRISYVKVDNTNHMAPRPAEATETTATADKITVYPNPVTDVLHVDGLTTGKDFEEEVYNMEGKLMMKSSNTADINTVMLAKGTYVLKVKQDKTVQAIQFVKK